MARFLTTCVVAALAARGLSADCSSGASGACHDETSLLQVEQTVKRAGEVPRQMQQPIPASHPPSEELSEGELPEVLRKAADEDLAAIKKAKASRAKAAGKVGGKATADVKPPTDLDVAAKQKKTEDKVAAKQKAARTSDPSVDSTVNQMKADKTVRQADDSGASDMSGTAATDTASASATMDEVSHLTQQKMQAMEKEKEYMDKYAAAQKVAREAQAGAIADMKKAQLATKQATQWHLAATSEHEFFEKASAAERAALEKGQAIEKVHTAKAALHAKESKKESASAELASVAKTAQLSEKAAFASEGSKGLSLAVEEQSKVASYERPSQQYADWAW